MLTSNTKYIRIAISVDSPGDIYVYPSWHICLLLVAFMCLLLAAFLSTLSAISAYSCWYVCLALVTFGEHPTQVLASAVASRNGSRVNVTSSVSLVPYHLAPGGARVGLAQQETVLLS